MLNLISIALGLIGWAIPIAAMGMAAAPRRWPLTPILSFTACGSALVVQFFEILRRVNKEDWSALIDVTPTLAKVTVALLGITVIMNLLSWGIRAKMTQK